MLQLCLESPVSSRRKMNTSIFQSRGVAQQDLCVCAVIPKRVQPSRTEGKWNPGKVWVGKDLKDDPIPTPKHPQLIPSPPSPSLFASNLPEDAEDVL